MSATEKWEIEDTQRAASVISSDIQALLNAHPIDEGTMMNWIMFILIVDGKVDSLKEILKNHVETRKGKKDESENSNTH